MNLTNTQNKKRLYLITAILCSLLWVGYQILLWHSSAQFLNQSRSIIEAFGIRVLNRDTEWRRGTSVLAYCQTLLHVLLAYCLFIKWPKKKNALRITCVALTFCLSLLMIPRIAGMVFPSYRIFLSPNNPGYARLLLIHGLVGVIGVLVAFIVDAAGFFKNKPTGKSVINSLAQYGLTVVIAFLIAVCYGFVLGILNHFNSDAVKYVLQAFGPDNRLITGIITMAVMAPLMEEMAFRGLIMRKTQAYSSAWVGVIFSSILFGLWHRNLGQFFPTTVMGNIFAWIYIKSGKLRHAMVAHSLSNVLLAIAQSRGDGYLPEIGFMTTLRETLLEVSLPLGILGLLAALALIAFLIGKGYPYFSKADKA